MKNLSIRSKLYLLSAIGIIALAIVSAVGLNGIRHGNASISEIGEVRLPSVEGLMEIQLGIARIRSENLRAALFENDYNAQEQFARLLQNQGENWALVASGWKEYAPLPKTEEEAVLWKQFDQEFANWRDQNGKISTIIEQLGNNHDEATQKALFRDFHAELEYIGPMFKAASSTLGKIVDLNVQVANDSVNTGTAGGKQARILMLSAAAIAILAMAILSWLVARAILTPLQTMQNGMHEIAEHGDFTKRIPVPGKDEIGDTIGTFNGMIEKLQAAFSVILSQAIQVQAAAEQLSSASQQVASGSSNQSEAASSMAAAVEEMTVSIGHISENARDSQKMSREAGQISDEGGNIIQSAANEMTEIAQNIKTSSQAISQLGQNSEDISAIVNVIKEIADQTNLLALNAAIEAARAGEQGRGFAVVADEVRKLAERTSKSTDEITGMIDTMQASSRQAISSIQSTVSRVEQGVNLANQAGESIVTIKQRTRDTAAVADEISAALAEQSSASEEIARKVELVAQMTEENSTAAEQTAGTAANLQDLANSMSATVNRFKV